MTLESIPELLKERGIKLSDLSRATGISYMALYDSLFNKRRDRPLKASEFLTICKYLDISPADFVETVKK